MRPTRVILLALAAGTLLAGCGADEDEPTPTAAAPSPTVTATSTAEARSPTVPPPASTGDGTPRPPEASITGGGQTATAGFGSFCWSDPVSGTGVCADSAAPSCGDSFTPHLAVPAGTPVEWLFQFAPTEGPLLTIHGPDGLPADEQPVLPAGMSTQWQVDLPPGEHAVSLFVRPTDGGDVSYTACLEVTPEGSGAVPSPDGASWAARPEDVACAARWNAEANDAVRAEAAGPALGAIVAPGPDACTVTIVRLADEGGFTAFPFVEVHGGAFAPGGARPGTADDAIWSLGADGALVAPGSLSASPAPGPAVLSTPSAGEAIVGPSGWGTPSEGTELDVVGCPEPENMPLVRVRAGETMTFALPFAPAGPPVLTFLDGPRAFEEIPLEATAAPAWTIDLPAGQHTAKLEAQTPDGVSASYSACLDVAG